MNEVNKVASEDANRTPTPEGEGIPEFLQRKALEETKEVKDPVPAAYPTC